MLQHGSRRTGSNPAGGACARARRGIRARVDRVFQPGSNRPYGPDCVHWTRRSMRLRLGGNVGVPRAEVP